jgi:hypothetical protein
MALRKLLREGLPEPPDEAPGLRTMLMTALDSPMLAPIRIFWDNLNTLRPIWPVLLPLLAWVGWRTYQRERAAVLGLRQSE